jgi:hypothetical protein
MEVWAKLGFYGLEAIRDANNSWHRGIAGLRQARRPGVAALRAEQFFIPLIGRRRLLFRRTLMAASRTAGCSKLNSLNQTNNILSNTAPIPGGLPC